MQDVWLLGGRPVRHCVPGAGGGAAGQQEGPGGRRVPGEDGGAGAEG